MRFLDPQYTVGKSLFCEAVMGKFHKVLLASDFDNTLVYTQGALERGEDIPPMSVRSRAALDYFIANGGLFAVSTGRALPAFADYAKDLPCNVPCVIANGAALYDFQRGRYLCTAFFSERIYAQMDELLERFPQLTRAKTQMVSDFREVDLPIIKLLFEDDRPILDEVYAFIRSRPWSEEYELIFSSDHLLEMTAHGATKGGMVLRLADLLGVARKDIYCVGDHLNDIPMLQIAAIGFAPENSVPEVLSCGAQIVCHCRDGAIADVIEILDKRY